MSCVIWPLIARRVGGAVLVALGLAACGISIPIPRMPPAPKIPSIPSFKTASGDTAEFFFDPEQVTVIQSGRIQVDFGVPALRYRGALGCRGRL